VTDQLVGIGQSLAVGRQCEGSLGALGDVNRVRAVLIGHPDSAIEAIGDAPGSGGLIQWCGSQCRKLGGIHRRTVLVGVRCDVVLDPWQADIGRRSFAVVTTESLNGEHGGNDDQHACDPHKDQLPAIGLQRSLLFSLVSHPFPLTPDNCMIPVKEDCTRETQNEDVHEDRERAPVTLNDRSPTSLAYCPYNLAIKASAYACVPTHPSVLPVLVR
jgi:hypothetical protein